MNKIKSEEEKNQLQVEQVQLTRDDESDKKNK